MESQPFIISFMYEIKYYLSSDETDDRVLIYLKNLVWVLFSIKWNKYLT